MIDAEPASERAEALLTATNRFLRSDDPQALADALVRAVDSMFAPDKVAVFFRGRAGGYRVMSRRGQAPGGGDGPPAASRREIATALLDRAFDGAELCTDDPDSEAFAAQVREYGGASGLALPIRDSSGPVAVLVVLHDAPVPFDPPVRDAARNLCAQAGIAIELLEARQDLLRQTRLASALLAVSQRLATLTDPDDVPAALIEAIRAATGASIALVARWSDAESRVSFAAIDGLAPDEVRTLRNMEPVADQFGMVQGGLQGRAAVLVPPFDPDDVPVDLVARLGVTAVAGAPISVDGQTWGFLVVATRGGDPGIVETGAEMLAGFASIAATALGRTNAIAELERGHELLESTVAERTRELTDAVSELRRASQAKTEFLSNVSHELRTPLTSILGFTDLLLHGLEGPLTGAQHEDLRTIEISGGRLLGLIDDLIDVSRIEADDVDLRIGPIELGAFLGRVVAETRPRADHKALRLSLDLGDAPAVITADSVRLDAILANLLSNAIKFTPRGGTIHVEARRADAANVRIDVVDSGIGIAPDELDKVFEKFYRLAPPEVPGTGLGLAIARHYAHLHGGDLTVASTEGAGSRFMLRLPIEPGPGRGV